MATKPNIKYHAIEWSAVFDWLELNREKDFVLPCPTKRRADAVRLDFYRARSAMLRDPGAEDNMYPTLRAREATIVENPQGGFSMLIRSREKTPMAQLLRESLEYNERRLKNENGKGS